MFTTSTIAGIVLAFVQLGLRWFESKQDELLRQAGEDREKLRQHQKLSELAAQSRAIDERFARMTDDEVKDEITKQGDWRD